VWSDVVRVFFTVENGSIIGRIKDCSGVVASRVHKIPRAVEYEVPTSIAIKSIGSVFASLSFRVVCEASCSLIYCCILNTVSKVILTMGESGVIDSVMDSMSVTLNSGAANVCCISPCTCR
jgi:hypothetical protein